MKHLILKHEELYYALEAFHLQEILWMPKLTPLKAATSQTIGSINYRGEVIPVIDIHRLRRKDKHYSIDANLIVIKGLKNLFGLLVDKALHFEDFNAEIEEAYSSQTSTAKHRFVHHIIPKESQLIGILDLEKMEANLEEKGIERRNRTDWSHFSEEEMEILDKRAKRISSSIDLNEDEQTLSFAFFKLGKEVYAVELVYVQEIVKIPKIVPIPGTPESILGNVNLMGSIYTVLDFQVLLSVLQTLEIENEEKREQEEEAILINYQNIQFAIKTDFVKEIEGVGKADIKSDVEDSISKNRYLSRYVYHKKKIVGVLNLNEIIKEIQ